MYRLIFPITALSILVACDSKSTSADTGWWSTGDSSDNGSTDDDEDDDDEEGDYAEYFLEGTRGEDGSFSGEYGYEAAISGAECFSGFNVTGVSADPCDGCDGALTITLGEGESDGECALPDSLPASKEGDSFTFGWSGETLQIKADSGWSTIEGGEVLEEDGMWGFWVELMGGDDDDDDDDE